MSKNSNTIADIGDDIAEQMLNAITREEDTTTNNTSSNIPFIDRKKFLITNINLVSVFDRKDIGNIMIMNNRRNAIRECSEGSVINLDTQPDYIINQMYDLIVHKLNKRK